MTKLDVLQQIYNTQDAIAMLSPEDTADAVIGLLSAIAKQVSKIDEL